MENKISRQYFRVLPIRYVSREDVFATILYDASCPTALLGGNTFSTKYKVRFQPCSQSSSAISEVTSPVKLVGKICEDAIGSKTPLVTQIARTGLGTRLVRSLLGRPTPASERVSIR